MISISSFSGAEDRWREVGLVVQDFLSQQHQQQKENIVLIQNRAGVLDPVCLTWHQTYPQVSTTSKDGWPFRGMIHLSLNPYSKLKTSIFHKIQNFLYLFVVWCLECATWVMGDCCTAIYTAWLYHENNYMDGWMMGMDDGWMIDGWCKPGL